MNKIPVMIVEDDVRAIYTLESTINQHAQFQVVAVSESISDAKMQFELYTPTLCFVDISLPDGNGVEFIGEQRKKNTLCDFIITTAEKDCSTVKKSVQLGVCDYLVKPLRMSRVMQSLDDFIPYRQQLDGKNELNQGDIDSLFGKSSLSKPRQTPKGIDDRTLSSVRQLIQQNKMNNFSADEIGKKMQVSRVTARRYLEFLESEGEISLILNYNTGGRPSRLYQVNGD
ncbi:response regulator [Vibrio marisflavi]|uniref:Transcriptional regulatory protein n=1 Tax=Vibrio marisflavi CECT 7928 TaxID=634439 RepID=A0ABN8E0H5_9VIBR|nr:response regulator [Vibrio marisflavi]CAH0536237.1 Transcriptional regulatory protein CitB [Vibrio marisflavi CECT 7928]